jgi:prepilin-type N-terminal cleavage/methylation domain-containing protein
LKNKNKLAFTMIELVFVIVVLGILASLAMGRMERDLRQEAASTILSHIRLTQQFAMNDNKHRSDNDAKWQRAYWQFGFRACGTSVAYRVGSDISLGGGGVNGIGTTEAGIDPVDGKYLRTASCSENATNESPSVLITKKYGILNSGVVQSGGCSSRSISFDYLGRPHTNAGYNNPDFTHIMTEDCNFTFTLQTDQDSIDGDDTFSIIIEAETGHAFIVGQENS